MYSSTSSTPSTQPPSPCAMSSTAHKNIRLVCEIIIQARVRTGCDFSSLRVTDLPEGTMVLVEEVVHNRARITLPIHGWLSIFSKSGVQILRKVNEETDKIGGKAIVPIRVKSDQNTYKIIYIECKIVDYNEKCHMHKIQCETGSQRWVSLNDPNITYIPQHKQIRSETVYPKKQTEAVLEKCFTSDYPHFASKKLIQNLHIKKAEDHQSDADNNDLETQCEETQTVSTAPYASNHTAALEEKKEEDVQSTVATEETEIDDINDEEEEDEAASQLLNDQTIDTEITNNNEEIVKKMKDIEQRIVTHLHLRGYYEDNPDFWKYIAKAKEIAIVKVQKERQKWLEAANRNNCVY